MIRPTSILWTDELKLFRHELGPYTCNWLLTNKSTSPLYGKDDFMPPYHLSSLRPSSKSLPLTLICPVTSMITPSGNAELISSL